MSTVRLKNTNLISVADAAKILNLTTGRIRQLVYAKKLKGELLTPRALAVDVQSVEKYQAAYRKPGPKPAA